MRFALKRFGDVSVHPSFSCLEQRVLEDLVADDRLEVASEEAVLEVLSLLALLSQRYKY